MGHENLSRGKNTWLSSVASGSIGLLCAAWFATFASAQQQTAITQTRQAGAPPASASGQTQPEPLETSSEVTAYFQGLFQRLSRQGTDLLVEIDEAYSTAVREISAENSRRLNELFARQRTELAALRELELSSDERSRRSAAIQAELDSGRAALREWFESEGARIRNAHTAGRDAQRNFQSDLIERIQVEQRRVLDDLSDGPVDVRALLAAIGVSDGPSGIELPEQPARPEIRVQMPATDMPGTSAGTEGTSEPVNAIVDPVVDVKINTETAPERLEIGVYAIRNIAFNGLSARLGGGLTADDVTLEIVIANRGTVEWDQDGNRVEVRFAQGLHDYSQTDQVVAVGSARYYDAEGIYDFTIPVENGIVVPMLVKGLDRVRSTVVPVPNPFPNFRRPLRLRRIGIRAGTAPVEIAPDLWYTMDVRLYPAGELDQTLADNGAFFHFIVKSDGSLADQDELVFYKPGPPRLVDER